MPTTPLEINKSTRHQLIIGRFGEYAIANWLSRSGFEVTIVDHTGIDLIAYHPPSGRRLGITVKSRTRAVGKEYTSVRLFSGDDRQKLSAACLAFGCEPWIALYVETLMAADIFLTNLSHFDTNYSPGNSNRIINTFRVRADYTADPEVRHIHIDFLVENWSWS